MAQKRDSIVGIALRNPWTRLAVAVVGLAVAAYVWWLLFTFFRDTLEMDFLAYTAGLIFAVLLYLGVGLMYRRFGPKARPGHLSQGALARETKKRLAHLPSITHTVHPLGDPWPEAVIGPTGIFVVLPKVVEAHIGLRDNVITLDHLPAGRDLFGDVPRLMQSVSDLMARNELEIRVRGILVVDESRIVPANLKEGDRELLIVPDSELLDVIEFGTAMTPQVVQRAAELIEHWRPSH